MGALGSQLVQQLNENHQRQLKHHELALTGQLHEAQAKHLNAQTKQMELAAQMQAGLYRPTPGKPIETQPAQPSNLENIIADTKPAIQPPQVRQMPTGPSLMAQPPLMPEGEDIATGGTSPDLSPMPSQLARLAPPAMAYQAGQPAVMGVGPEGPSPYEQMIAALTPEYQSIARFVQASTPEHLPALLQHAITKEKPYLHGGPGTQFLDPTTMQPVYTVPTAEGEAKGVTAENRISKELYNKPYGKLSQEEAAAVNAKMEKEAPDASPYTNIQSDPLNPEAFVGMNKKTGRMEHIPSALGQSGGGVSSTLTGEAFLKTIPEKTAAQVKALSEGRMQFPAGFALKSPYWQNMISLVAKYDPTFDAVNYNARAATRRDFTSGQSARMLNALNTVMGHLENFDKTMKTLDNSGNMVWNWLRNVAGAPFNPELKAKLNKFNIDKQAVTEEFERAYRGAGGSQADIQAWKQSFSAADSPEAMRATLQEGTQLLGSKIQALGDTYNKGMGTTKEGLDLLSPHAKHAYEKLSGLGEQQAYDAEYQKTMEDLASGRFKP